MPAVQHRKYKEAAKCYDRSGSRRLRLLSEAKHLYFDAAPKARGKAKEEVQGSRAYTLSLLMIWLLYRV